MAQRPAITPWSSGGHRLVARMVIPLMLLLVALPAMALAQHASGPVQVYRSPEFGYLFWWDPAVWTVQVQQAEAGSDWIELVSDTTIVDLWGFKQPGGSSEDCIAFRLEEIAGSPDLVRFEDLRTPGTQPTPVLAPVSWVELVLALETPEGRQTYAAREVCTPLGAGDVLLNTGEWVLAETYNAQSSRFLAAPLGTVTLPRSALTLDPATRTLRNPQGFIVAYQLLDAAAQERGIITPQVANCFYPGRPSAVVVENTGLTDLTVAPDDVIVDKQGVVLAPTAMRWLRPALDEAQSVVVPVGEMAVLELGFPESALHGELVYRNPAGVPVSLGSAGGCDGAGGGAPIVIDMD